MESTSGHGVKLVHTEINTKLIYTRKKQKEIILSSVQSTVVGLRV